MWRHTGIKPQIIFIFYRIIFKKKKKKLSIYMWRLEPILHKYFIVCFTLELNAVVPCIWTRTHEPKYTRIGILITNEKNIWFIVRRTAAAHRTKKNNAKILLPTSLPHRHLITTPQLPHAEHILPRRARNTHTHTHLVWSPPLRSTLRLSVTKERWHARIVTLHR